MKTLVIVFAASIVLGLTTFAEKNYYAEKMYTVTSNTVSKALPSSPARDPCTCSCGKDCAGTCTAHFEGCGLGDGLRCILDCCTGIPNDCSGQVQ
jgi:hypothetical protein